MRHRGWILGLVCCIALGLTARAADIPWRQTASVAFDEAFTTAFAWGSDGIGLLDPNTAQIAVFDFNGKERSRISLRGNVAAPSGNVFPDPVQRAADGRIYWLRKRLALLLVFSPDGDLQKTITANIRSPFWFEVEPAGDVLFYGTDEFSRTAQYVRVDVNGKLKETSPGWLPARPKDNKFTSQFFFNTPLGRVELLAYFPMARRAGRAVDFADCSAWSGPISMLVATQASKFPQASEAKATYQPETAEFPTLLDASKADDGSVFALGNGSVVLRLFGPNDRACWSVPPPRNVERYVLTSIAAVKSHVAILTVLGGHDGRLLRIWDLGARAVSK